ncbi:MAG TPA: HEAT repeat domain-containing protein [Polyangiales bacterium]
MAWLLPPLPPNFEAALRDVRGRRVESRLSAAERLGRADADERVRAIEGLRVLSGDAHPSVRATALAGLGMLEAREALDLVLAGLHDGAPEVRELATLAAAQIGGDEVVEAMRTALASEAPEVRFQAVAALAELAPERAGRDLLPLLSDPDPEVRGQVVAGLSSLDEAHLAGHFAGALEDEHPSVRLEAALALAALDDKRGEAELLRALIERERLLEVAGALAELGCQRALEPLARLAGSLFTSPHVRAATGAALIRLGDVRGIAALRRVLTGFRPDARSYAVELVGETRALALLPQLVALVQRPRGVDPMTLVEALAEFGGEPGVQAALHELGKRGDDVGERARRALAK